MALVKKKHSLTIHLDITPKTVMLPFGLVASHGWCLAVQRGPSSVLHEVHPATSVTTVCLLPDYPRELGRFVTIRQAGGHMVAGQNRIFGCATNVLRGKKSVCCGSFKVNRTRRGYVK